MNHIIYFTGFENIYIANARKHFREERTTAEANRGTIELYLLYGTHIDMIPVLMSQ